jgi:hypothetical protein
MFRGSLNKHALISGLVNNLVHNNVRMNVSFEGQGRKLKKLNLSSITGRGGL